jgi:hypothetical protein
LLVQDLEAQIVQARDAVRARVDDLVATGELKATVFMSRRQLCAEEIAAVVNAIEIISSGAVAHTQIQDAENRAEAFRPMVDASLITSAEAPRLAAMEQNQISVMEALAQQGWVVPRGTPAMPPGRSGGKLGTP